MRVLNWHASHVSMSLYVLRRNTLLCFGGGNCVGMKLKKLLEKSLLSGSVFFVWSSCQFFYLFVWSSCQFFYFCRRKGKRICLNRLRLERKCEITISKAFWVWEGRWWQKFFLFLHFFVTKFFSCFDCTVFSPFFLWFSKKKVVLMYQWAVHHYFQAWVLYIDRKKILNLTNFIWLSWWSCLSFFSPSVLASGFQRVECWRSTKQTCNN